MYDKKIYVWNIKGLHHQEYKDIGTRKFEFVPKTQFLFWQKKNEDKNPKMTLRKIMKILLRISGIFFELKPEK